MDSNGLQTILDATPTQLEMLERKLTPGQAYAFLLHADSKFIPSSVVAYLRPLDDGFELRLAHPIRCDNCDDAELRQFAHAGCYYGETISEIVGFLRHNFGSRTTQIIQVEIAS